MLSAYCLDGVAEKAPPTQVLTAYGLFVIAIISVYLLVANGEFSSILTLSVMAQCLSYVLLGMQVVIRGNTAGVSGRSLRLDALSLVCRLASTTWLNGYLPVDASGDHIYQAVEVGTLLIAVWLIGQVRKERADSREASLDSLPVHWLSLGCLVLAALFHADMNSRPVFDTLWMLSVFLGSIAVLPQLWLISQLAGKVEAFTCHRMAAMAVSRLLSGVFMWHARGDITCSPWVEGFNHAVWAILGAHLLHFLLLGDFAYYYLKAVLAHGFSSCEMDLQLDLVV